MKGLRLAYAGTPEFAVPALRALAGSPHRIELVITQPDRPAGRGRKLTPSPVKIAAKEANLPLLQPANVNNSEFLRKLQALDLELLIVAAFGQLFGDELLALPRLGCINIHASLLPRWRGASPIQHAILAGDTFSGVSIMQMEQRMDAGDIWVQTRCEIDAQETAQSLHDKLAVLSATSLLEAIKIIASGEFARQPQDESRATYCSKLRKQDGCIDWAENTTEILRKIRAFYPWPGAYTVFQGRRLAITRAVAGEMKPSAGVEPGTVIKADKGGIVVTTGDHSVCIKELIPAGAKLMQAANFANSNHMVQTVLAQEV